MASQLKVVDEARRLAVCGITTLAEHSGQNVAQPEENAERNQEGSYGLVGHVGTKIQTSQKAIVFQVVALIPSSELSVTWR